MKVLIFIEEFTIKISYSQLLNKYKGRHSMYRSKPKFKSMKLQALLLNSFRSILKHKDRFSSKQKKEVSKLETSFNII